MLNHKPDTGWPPDMGYWMGYHIDQAFYAQAKDKTASEPCWGVTDFKAYLKASGYPVRREPCVPEKTGGAGQLMPCAGPNCVDRLPALLTIIG